MLLSTIKPLIIYIPVPLDLKFRDSYSYTPVYIKIIEYKPSDAVKAAKIVTQAIVGVGATIGISVSVATMTSPQGLWCMINLLQLLMLLPLTGAYIPNNVLNYIYGMEFAMLSLNFIPIDNIIGVKQVVEYFSFTQKTGKLK
jgi:hypothetical protein